MRRSAGERRSASARPAARRGHAINSRRADGGSGTFESVDCGPVILTRGELARRTRERSKLAALKLAEEQGKARLLTVCNTVAVVLLLYC